MRFLLLALMTLGTAFEADSEADHEEGGALVMSAHQAAGDDRRMPLRYAWHGSLNLNAP